MIVLFSSICSFCKVLYLFFVTLRHNDFFRSFKILNVILSHLNVCNFNPINKIYEWSIFFSFLLTFKIRSQLIPCALINISLLNIYIFNNKIHGWIKANFYFSHKIRFYTSFKSYVISFKFKTCLCHIFVSFIKIVLNPLQHL